ncbi:hypothetical protein BO86DRAFT_354211 [Aspergillus japonicus CBS 114.51]|uniref:Zn(2)-C6 fungal-type domain-containing protein n=1 Tax=Aspergillus japonicus CBS 114.51 TaxID=1448312 RepID=A0A8T8XBF5_ASPJA|nr:hypothetical protein BO86DRAFT_354211 [Aspergillus japonicus CBS 114.51]RAH85563.1 hypothetical protein BO86DRAFT_354211 [Aspergillus japonicus CBS 114.51]
MASSTKKPDGRVWKACFSCRRKKIKCDGEQPCFMCESRNHLCEYPETNDHAANSRRYATSLEERCQHMDNLCIRLEGLAQTLSQYINHAQAVNHPCNAPDHIEQCPTFGYSSVATAISTDHVLGMTRYKAGVEPPVASPVTSHPTSPPPSYRASADLVGHMVADSYGRLRYVGGVANNMVIEAVQSLCPASNQTSCEQNNSIRRSEVELPFFTRDKTWPDLPYLPQAREMTRPPRYISDLLIDIYFERLHYTFPILYQPDFMIQYQKLKDTKDLTGLDRGFLAVYFAICACASGLLPQAPGASTLAGMEYYQKALLMFFASSGEVFIEQVQCLGLLALCCAGWNVLAQGWRLAGQAVRIAQDLGLHLSSLREPQGKTPSLSELKEAQIARCVWWSVFEIDCLTSICLGRPMAAHVAHVCCELPLDISNEDLDQGYDYGNKTQRSHSSMMGFIALIRLCKVAADVHHFHLSNRMGRGDSSSRNWTTLLTNVNSFTQQLDNWVQGLPNEIRFSANKGSSGLNLTMSAIAFLVHSAILMNLYRPLLGCERPESHSLLRNPSSECLGAAQSCIQAAELIHDCIPPSHHLAFCVQYLTISGIFVYRLRMTESVDSGDRISQGRTALALLTEIERVWPGASRSRSILERLLQDPDDFDGASQSTPLSMFDGFSWEDFPGADMIDDFLRNEL